MASYKPTLADAMMCQEEASQATDTRDAIEMMMAVMAKAAAKR